MSWLGGILPTEVEELWWSGRLPLRRDGPEAVRVSTPEGLLRFDAEGIRFRHGALAVDVFESPDFDVPWERVRSLSLDPPEPGAWLDGIRHFAPVGHPSGHSCAFHCTDAEQGGRWVNLPRDPKVHPAFLGWSSPLYPAMRDISRSSMGWRALGDPDLVLTFLTRAAALSRPHRLAIGTAMMQGFFGRRG